MTNGASEFDAAPEGADARLRAVERAVIRIQATLDSEFPRLRAEIGQLESGVDAKLASLETRIMEKQTSTTRWLVSVVVAALATMALV